MSNILRGQDSIDIIKTIAETYEDDYVNNDTQEISELYIKNTFLKREKKGEKGRKISLKD